MSSEGWTPCGLITLTTDFGVRDPFVGIMKGVIYDRFPAARIVDLTHDIQPYWPVEAGFWLARSAQYFPVGSVHLAVVDPGVGSERQSLILEARKHLFVAPDNGLLTSVWERFGDDVSLWYLDLDRVRRLNVESLSATFHGRDLYAPVAAALASGVCGPADLGEPTSEFVRAAVPIAVGDPEVVTGFVVTIDRFGNLISNIEEGSIDSDQELAVVFRGNSLPLVRTYSDAKPGEIVALVNSFGVLEIAQVQGNATLALQAERGAKVEVRPRSSGQR